MNEVLVTIVVPIYNVEKYLDRCINSLVNQTYSNLEIILVDDGSPDNCPSMCEEWAKKDNRIKVIHKINAGLGMARNTGIENANGKYIYFVDSDDYIALETVEKVVKVAEKEKADIVTFGLKKVSSNGLVISEIIPKTPKLVYEGKEIVDYVLPNGISYNPKTGKNINIWLSASGGIYNLEKIKSSEWRFVSEREIISEDLYSLLKFYAFVNKIAVIPEAFYYYCDNEKSLTYSYQEDRFERLKYFYDECVKVCINNKYSADVFERIGIAFLSYVIGAFKTIYKADLDKKCKRKQLRNIINDSLLQEVVHNIPIKNETFKRKILFYAIRFKMTWAVEFMVNAKIKR